MNKEKIIKKSKEFTEIINMHNNVKNKYFNIFYKKCDEENKYGITIPKKIGKANIRNKLKRQVKNIIMTNEKNIPNNIYYVIIIKEAALSLKYNDMVKELLNIIKKVGK